MSIKSAVERVAGIVCEKAFPIPQKIYFGTGSTVSVCALSSIDLLKKISKHEMMKNLVIAGRLFSENRGIDQLIQYCIKMPQIRYLIICGEDTKGHYPGDSLVNLSENGVNKENMIIGTRSKKPYLESDIEDILKFQKQIKVIDMRGCFDLEIISKTVNNLCS